MCGADAMTSSAEGVSSQPATSTTDPEPAGESRKVRKPLMEKRRRARINHSLDELRRMLDSERPGAGAQEGSRASKLEKADILELTVERLQRLRRDHEALKKRLEGGGGQEAARRFRAGYRECAREAARLLGAAAPALRQRLARHLAARLCQLELPAVRPTRLAGGDLALVTAAGPGRDEDPRGPVWRPW